MNKLSLRVLASIAVVVIAAALIECTCVRVYQCNLIEREAQVETDAAWNFADRSADTSRSIIVARRVLARLSPCLSTCAGNVGLYMIAAADLRLLGRDEEAQHYYTLALDYDRRPEIYFNLGVTELALGRRDAAIQHFVIAGKSGMYTNFIEDSAVRDEVLRRLAAQPSPRS